MIDIFLYNFDIDYENKYCSCKEASALLLKKHFNDSEIYKGEFGKPYILNGLFFNVSHSDNLIGIAKSNSEVGLDIEKIKELNDKTIKLISKRISNNKIDLDSKALLTIWTIKESISKLIGKGLRIDFKSIIVDSNNVVTYKNKKYYYKSEIIDDYIITVSSTTPIESNLHLEGRL